MVKMKRLKSCSLVKPLIINLLFLFILGCNVYPITSIYGGGNNIIKKHATRVLIKQNFEKYLPEIIKINNLEYMTHQE